MNNFQQVIFSLITIAFAEKIKMIIDNKLKGF